MIGLSNVLMARKLLYRFYLPPMDFEVTIPIALNTRFIYVVIERHPPVVNEYHLFTSEERLYDFFHDYYDVDVPPNYRTERYKDVIIHIYYI